MGDIKRIGNNFLEGEKVVCRPHVHGAALLPWAFFTIVFIVAVAIWDKKGIEALAYVGTISLFIAIFFFFKGLKAYFAPCDLTTMRLIQYRGFKTIDIPLYMCKNVSATQGALGKLLGYGTVVATDGKKKIKLSCIASPLLFRDNINQQIEVAPTELPLPKLTGPNARIAETVGWTPTRYLYEWPTVLVINDNTNRFAIVHQVWGLDAEFGFEDIISAEIRVGKQVITTKKSISAVGAIAGGIISGGLGAVVGGVGLGSSETNTKLSKIVIHVLLRKSDRMTLDIPCRTMNDAQEEMDLFIYAIDKADAARQNTATQQPISAEQPKSKINDLKDLAELYTKGLISEEEYKKLKSGLIE